MLLNVLLKPWKIMQATVRDLRDSKTIFGMVMLIGFVIISVPGALVLGLCLIVFPAWIGYLLLGMIKLVLSSPWIDPDYWNRKFIDYMGDVEWCKHLLKEAGL